MANGQSMALDLIDIGLLANHNIINFFEHIVVIKLSLTLNHPKMDLLLHKFKIVLLTLDYCLLKMVRDTMKT